MMLLLRWQDNSKTGEKPPAKKKRARSVKASTATASTKDDSSRPQLVLELQDESEQQAATAVLSSLYLLKPLPELLSELSQEQQLQAAVLADKWQVPNVSTAAAQLLANAVTSEAGLSEAVKQIVLSAQALPDCLQPLLNSLLLSMLGNLEAVWADADLQKQLLDLSLPSMEALLSCDELKVACEDTVLYTVQQYLSTISTAQQQHARQQLAPLIRCQHLSLFWLTASVLSDAADTLPLAGLQPYVKKLLLLRSARPALDFEYSKLTWQSQQALSGAPDSWKLGQRSSTPLSQVNVTWKVEVSSLRELAQRAHAGAKTPLAPAIETVRRPLRGVAFTPSIKCVPVGTGVELGMYVHATNVASDTSVSFKFRLDAGGVSRTGHAPAMPGLSAWGWRDYFGLGPMPGGWDEVKWAAKGLPASGELSITLTVLEVSHMPPAPPAAP